MGWKDMFATAEDIEDTQPVVTAAAAPAAATTAAVGGAIALFEPRTFDEATMIADKIKNGSAAAVNLHRLSKDYAQRTIDFLTGVVYALNGRIEKVGHNLILCSPASMKLSGIIEMNRDAE
ncbi:MAG: cell division protein SepF [Solobacterium sp.]|nr:cell division protein SepF [Solobacterium sp.]